MLRITVQEGEKAKIIKLERKIIGSLGSKELHLDLLGVAFVDTKGRQLLREIYQRTDTSFLADSPLTRYFPDDAMQHSPNAGEEGV